MARYFRDCDKHYGQYGKACMNTGQFDAGECWICQVQSGKMNSDEAKQLIYERKTCTGKYEYLKN